MNYKLIALDLDGTLLGPDKTVSPRNAAALLRAVSAGTQIMICSGRIYPEAEACIGGILDCVSLISACNGADIRERALQSAGPAVSHSSGAPDPESSRSAPFFQSVASHPIPQAILASLLWTLSKSDLFYMIYTSNEVYLQRSVFERFDNYHRYIEGRRSPHVIVNDLIDSIPEISGRAFKLMAMNPDPEKTALVRAEIEERDDIELSSSWRDNIEITARGIDKGSALNDAQRLLGIPCSEMIAIGDNENDIPMLNIAGLGIAMGNSTAPARKAAAVMTLSNTDDGVAAAIETYIFHSRT